MMFLLFASASWRDGSLLIPLMRPACMLLPEKQSGFGLHREQQSAAGFCLWGATIRAICAASFLLLYVLPPVDLALSRPLIVDFAEYCPEAYKCSLARQKEDDVLEEKLAALTNASGGRIQWPGNDCFNQTVMWDPQNGSEAWGNCTRHWQQHQTFPDECMGALASDPAVASACFAYREQLDAASEVSKCRWEDDVRFCSDCYDKLHTTRLEDGCNHFNVCTPNWQTDDCSAAAFRVSPVKKTCGDIDAVPKYVRCRDAGSWSFYRACQPEISFLLSNYCSSHALIQGFLDLAEVDDQVGGLLRDPSFLDDPDDLSQAFILEKQIRAHAGKVFPAFLQVLGAIVLLAPIVGLLLGALRSLFARKCIWSLESDLELRLAVEAEAAAMRQDFLERNGAALGWFDYIMLRFDLGMFLLDPFLDTYTAYLFWSSDHPWFALVQLLIVARGSYDLLRLHCSEGRWTAGKVSLQANTLTDGFFELLQKEKTTEGIASLTLLVYAVLYVQSDAFAFYFASCKWALALRSVSNGCYLDFHVTPGLVWTKSDEEVYYSALPSTPGGSDPLEKACGVAGLTEKEYRDSIMFPVPGRTDISLANNDWVAQTTETMFGDWAEESLLQAERALRVKGFARPKWLDQ
ncbi:unnamed protein product, partial [Symbiodinium sp. KB8]